MYKDLVVLVNHHTRNNADAYAHILLLASSCCIYLALYVDDTPTVLHPNDYDKAVKVM